MLQFTVTKKSLSFNGSFFEGLEPSSAELAPRQLHRVHPREAYCDVLGGFSSNYNSLDIVSKMSPGVQRRGLLAGLEHRSSVLIAPALLNRPPSGRDWQCNLHLPKNTFPKRTDSAGTYPTTVELITSNDLDCATETHAVSCSDILPVDVRIDVTWPQNRNIGRPRVHELNPRVSSWVWRTAGQQLTHTAPSRRFVWCLVRVYDWHYTSRDVVFQKILE